MNKIVKNASWIVVCRIARSLLSLLITMLTARYFGPSNFGLIQYAAAITAFAEPIMQLGLNNTLVKEYVEDKDNEGVIMGTSAVMSVCSALMCIVGIVAFSAVTTGGDMQTMVVCALYSLCLIFQAIELAVYWFQYKLLARYSSVVSLIAFFMIAIYRFVLLACGASIYWFAMAQAIDFALIAAVLLVLYRRLGGQKLKFSWKMCRRLFANSRHYIIAGLMVTVFMQTDKIMIKLMIGDAANGFYSAAVSCANMCGFVFVALIDSMRPTILENNRIGRKSFEDSMALLYSIVIWLSLCLSMGISMFSGTIIKIVYGAEYMDAVGPLRLIVWYTTFAYLGAVRNVWILAREKQKYLWIINLCGALGNVVLNAVLIPYWGAMGAALASLVTQFFANVVMGWIIAPMRENNRILFRGADPRILIRAVKQLFGQRKLDNMQN